MTTEIMRHMPVNNMIQEYETAVEEATTAINLIISAQKRMAKTFGQYSVPILPNNRYGTIGEKAIPESLAILKENAWKGIIERTELKKILSEKRAKELAESLNAGTLPDITVENVNQFISNIRSNLGNYFSEAVTEVFEFLRPPSSDYKTNTEYDIGKKVILEWMFDAWCGSISMNYKREVWLVSLDNVFHLLDGKGTVSYPGDLVTIIRDNIKSMKAETDYFKLKWYKKGTLHIEFKRLDLLERLNAIGGGNRLKKAA